MSVYIKGERMPECCDECWALDDDGDYPRCRITGEQRGYTFRTKENRMSKCPLVNSDNNHESSINQEYNMTREVAQFILAYMDVHNDLESKAICMAIDALKGKEYE